MPAQDTQSTAKTNLPAKNIGQILTWVIAGLIVIVVLVIIVQVVEMMQTAPETAVETYSTTDIASSTPADELTATDITTITDGGSAPPSEEYLANEFDNLMNAFGVDNVSLDVVETHTESDIRALAAANVGQTAPPRGQYQAVKLYDNGVEKDLTALEEMGKGIYITANGDGTGELDLMGLKVALTYDDTAVYTEDGTEIPFVWYGDWGIVAAHHIEIEYEPM